MRSIVEPGSQAEQVGRLLLAVFVVIALPSLPLGTYISYPFAILTTWFHEMGHGLAALATGNQFDRLLIQANGSGLAEMRLQDGTSRFTRALISAGGPLGPVVVGALLILASAREKLWRPTMWAMASVIFLSVFLYVRSPVGYSVLPLVGAAYALIAWKAPAGFVRFMLQFTGMLGALSMVSDFDYLFREEIPGGLSDTGQIERALFLPHWVWATLILLTSATMVGARREWVNRILREWNKKGLIEYKHGKITILDLPEFEKERDRRIGFLKDEDEW